ncbi:hypothetical protein IWW49_002053 [Coemansia sp. RSA 1797]|nr:hypothetical protein IWW49_002053 [Coemansia sp. RSA 1797]
MVQWFGPVLPLGGLYNDHHFCYGYFVYAAAVLAKLHPEWAARHDDGKSASNAYYWVATAPES